MESKTSQSKSISLSERSQQYPPGVVYTDGKNLFCTTCNLSLDHTRKSTIDRHLSEKHRKRKAEIDSYETASSSKKRKGNKNSERRRDVIFDLTEAFVGANIPLEKIDNPKLHAFLNKHVINAGAIQNNVPVHLK
ncbi:UNVERIFIED_CONTAM: hypothetical protein FKN15_053827 [Acipenser sinensis]